MVSSHSTTTLCLNQQAKTGLEGGDFRPEKIVIYSSLSSSRVLPPTSLTVLRDMPYYRAWIYCINISIIIAEVSLVLLTTQTITHPLWTFVPVFSTDPNVIIYLTLMILQTFTCICGLSGIFYNKLVLLRVYWILTIPLVVLDLGMIFPFVEQISSVNKHFNQHLQTSIAEQMANNSACPIWQFVQDSLTCCSAEALQTFCSGQFGVCREESQCQMELIKWMHGRLDAISIVIYYILLPLKFIVIIVLREDIQRLFSRNEFSKYDWDTEDEEEYYDKDYSPYIKRAVVEQVALADPLHLVPGPSRISRKK